MIGKSLKNKTRELHLSCVGPRFLSTMKKKLEVHNWTSL
jgi:hypothetical protein